MKTISIILLLVTELALGFTLGQQFCKPTVVYEIRYITNEVIKEVPIEVIKEIPMKIIKEVQTEVLVTNYRVLSDWDNLDELKSFLASDDTNSALVLLADSRGIVKFDGQCEDIAFQLRDRATEIDKRLDTEILDKSECIRYKQYLPTGIYSLGARDGHYICKAVVGNEVWFVEPSNDKVWLAYYLD